MATKLTGIPDTFREEEGAGLLHDYYQENESLSNALMKRRQKLAQTQLHLGPESLAPIARDEIP